MQLIITDKIKTIMQPLLNIDINKMSVAERIQLAEDIWDSILTSDENLPITEIQQQELDNRLKQYKQNPDEGLSWETIKERFNR